MGVGRWKLNDLGLFEAVALKLSRAVSRSGTTTGKENSQGCGDRQGGRKVESWRQYQLGTSWVVEPRFHVPNGPWNRKPTLATKPLKESKSPSKSGRSPLGCAATSTGSVASGWAAAAAVRQPTFAKDQIWRRLTRTRCGIFSRACIAHQRLQGHAAATTARSFDSLRAPRQK